MTPTSTYDVRPSSSMRSAICELHDYRTKREWLFTDDDESGNEDTRFRQRFVSTIVAGADPYYSDDVREKMVRAHDDLRPAGLPATGGPGFGHVRAGGCGPKSGRRDPAQGR